ncbi:MAG: RluA family pseudouridine synthase [Sulfuricurvum sp.]|jgi:23S rRNA pseudouridine1911/1915/1917 synthase|uniref:RluA family pseudouridine synthase n=1 Tax=Sulfuricurvum sp. TaxID=2025608 RepID=UPI0025F66D3E|nr:RluA family pseudouridine synthase [Sulfuricurvum sp.]MCI4406077.1 RluA family pseudouridine synthase [Sulfuricurvum sp.]
MPFVSKKLFSPVRQMGITLLMNELGLSRSDAQRYIVRGRLSQNGVILDEQFGMVEGECDVVCFIPEPQGIKPLFVTNDFAIYDKPSGLRVHPNNLDGCYTLNDEIKHTFGMDANAAHRIDQETSGLVLVSRHKGSEGVIKQLFANRSISKYYLAMVRGNLKEPMEIHAPLFRNDHPNLKISMVVKVDSKGKPSHTSIIPLKYFPDIHMTLVKAVPHTGRTHQIRVHLFHVEHPIVGDPIYGQSIEDIHRYIDKEIKGIERINNTGASRLLLHAQSLEFEYGNEVYRIESEKDFVRECFEAMKI